jgi:ABC-2 type transport system permease protein
VKLGRSWALVKKELKEYRRQRFILTTLLVPPIVLAIVGPLSAALPLYLSSHAVSQSKIDEFPRPYVAVWLGPGNSTAYLANHTSNGELRMDHVGLIGLTLSFVILENSTLDASTLIQYSMNHTIASGSNLTKGVASDSLLLNSNIHTSVLQNCTGQGLKVWQTTVVGSPNMQIILNDGQGPASVALQVLGAYPLLMAILPAVLPAAVASYALVGEKMNRSLEPLLASRLTDRELLWGKILGILIPTLGVTALGFGLLAILSDVLLAGPLGVIFFPNAAWIISLFLLSPLLAFMAITISIIISSRTTDVRSAQELSSLLVLPLLVFFVGAILTPAFTNVVVLLVLGAGLLAIDVVLFWMAVDLFQREKILVTWK